MDIDPKGPREKREDKGEDPTFSSQPDMTPRREGGDDSLAESSPVDNRSDEKVIVNEQRSQKTVNAPSQTAANTDEVSGSDEDIVN